MFGRGRVELGIMEKLFYFGFRFVFVFGFSGLFYEWSWLGLFLGEVLWERFV